MLKQLAIGLAIGLPLVVGFLLAPWVFFALVAMIGMLFLAYILGDAVLRFKWGYM